VLIPGNISCAKQEKKLHIEMHGTLDEWWKALGETPGDSNFIVVGRYDHRFTDSKIFVLCTSYIFCIRSFLHEISHSIGYITMNNLSDGFAEFAPQLYMYPPNMYSVFVVLSVFHNINTFDIRRLLGDSAQPYQYTMNQLMVEYYYYNNRIQFYNLITIDWASYGRLFNESVIPDGKNIEAYIKQISSDPNAHLAKSFNPQFTQDLKEIDEYFYKTKMIINIYHINP